MNRDELREEIVARALAWEADPVAGKRNALIAAVQAYKGRRFYVAEAQGSQERRDIMFYDAGLETEWGTAPNVQRATRIVAQLNDRLAAGWNPEAP